ncbi:hypothetical protein [Streptomyces sp. WAC05858]|uniref:hypothetical protein n=1 Tax=Streptomyces TaxID=1883 RepID=UPI00163BB7F8|nr:hypothetical protein [Streptomyces sp. WAC05858]
MADKTDAQHRTLLARLEAEQAHYAEGAARTDIDECVISHSSKAAAFKIAAAHTIAVFEGAEAANAYMRDAASGRPEDVATSADPVIEVSEAEAHASARRSLAALGLTYEQLADQAQRGDFSSPQAQALWTAIGGTVDPAKLGPAPADGLPTDEDFLVALEGALEKRLLPEPGIGVLEDTRDAVMRALAPLVDQLRAEVQRQIDMKIGVAGEWGNALADKTAAENTLAQVREYMETSDDDGIRTREAVLRLLADGSPETPRQRLLRIQTERLLDKVRRNQQADSGNA